MPLPKAPSIALPATLSKAHRRYLRLSLSAIAAAVLTSPPVNLAAYAHQVELAEDIGGTLHIEPNDTPRAGEEVLAWVALTRKGGETLPLEDCNCQMNLYAQSQQDSDEPLLSPTLVAVEQESYEGIPGAEFIFPEVGAYTLEISGQPKAAAEAEGVEAFAPFELAFDVTVAQAVPKIPADSEAVLPDPYSQVVAEPEQAPSSLKRWITIGMGSAILLGLFGAVMQRSRRRS